MYVVLYFKILKSLKAYNTKTPYGNPARTIYQEQQLTKHIVKLYSTSKLYQRIDKVKNFLTSRIIN